ncbi:hypothetical protein ACWCSD_52295, partial [Nonomuraea sp. NPDC001684]
MRRRHVILGLVVLGFAVMAAVLHGRWQLADRPPQRYAECESNVAGADCARASEVFEDCRKGRVDQIGRFNCGRVIDLHSACGRRKGASDDLTCRLVAHDYLRCAVSGHGASACFAIEQAFLGCLDD